MRETLLNLKGVHPGTNFYFEQARKLTPIEVTLAEYADENGEVLEATSFV